LEGLEATEKKLSDLERTLRIDSEYFLREFISVAQKIEKSQSIKLTEICRLSDGNHFSISENFQDEGIPYFRGKDVTGNFFIEHCNSTFIDENTFWQKHMIRSHLKKGDILLSIIGTIGNLALVSSSNKATCSCKLAILRPKKNEAFIATFLSSKYGAGQIQRNVRGAVQMGFLLEDMDQISVPVFSPRLMDRIDTIVASSLDRAEEAKIKYAEAESQLLEAIGLKNWKPEEPLSYEVRAARVFSSGRIDAEYFRPGVENVLEQIKKLGAIKLGDESTITTGYPWKSEFFGEPGSSECPVVRIRDCKPGLLDINTLTCLDKNYALSEGAPLAKIGDILLGMDGIKWFYAGQVSAPCYVNQRVCHITINKSEEFPPEYVALVINSAIGQAQLLREMTIAQTVGHITNENARNLLIPSVTKKVRQEIRDAVIRSFDTESESKLLLEKAKRAVEIAIEEGEDAAGRYLDGKAYVQSSALPDLMASHAYFSTGALREYLEKQKLTYSPQTINTYISRMKGEGAIYGAGRGWYSSVTEAYETDTESVSEVVSNLESRFPMLEFACWSTGQLNPFLEHQLGKFVSFVYVERDVMNSVYEFLKDAGWTAYLNPTMQEAKKFFSVGEKTMVVRPHIEKAPLDGHFARIEKLLVDLHVERENLNLLDADEFGEAAQRLITTKRIELAKLIMYAGQRKVDWRELFSAPADIIAEGERE